MSESIQHKQARRPPRVHITFDVDIDGAIEKKEIPFIVGVLSDLSGETKKKPIVDRSFKGIAKHNFDDVLENINPTLKIKVKNMVDIKFQISKNIINRIDACLEKEELERNIVFTIIDYYIDKYIDKYPIRESDWKSFVEESNKKIDDLEGDIKEALAKQLKALEVTVFLSKNDIISIINDLQKEDLKNEKLYKNVLSSIDKSEAFKDNVVKDCFTIKDDKDLQNELERCISDKTVSDKVHERLKEIKCVRLSTKDDLKKLESEFKKQLPINCILNDEKHIKKFYENIFAPHEYKPNTKEAIKTIIDENAYAPITVPLSFNEMDDFNPENLIEKVDVLKKLRKTRDQLASLKGKTDGNYEFVSELDKIIKKLKNNSK